MKNVISGTNTGSAAVETHMVMFYIAL